MDLCKFSVKELEVLLECVKEKEKSIPSTEIFTSDEATEKHSTLILWMCQIQTSLDLVTAREKVLNN